MTTYVWPTAQIYIPQTQILRQIHNNQVYESPQSGFVQTNSTPGAKWGWAFDLQPHTKTDRQAIEATLTRLSGREHRMQIWDMRRPQPLGTINRNGVTVNASAGALAITVNLANCGANATLKAGDWMAFSTGQLVMVVADATANGSGVMTGVEFRHMLRTPLSNGSSVTLVKPSALYILTQSSLDFPRQGGFSEPPMSVEFTEVFS